MGQARVSGNKTGSCGVATSNRGTIRFEICHHVSRADQVAGAKSLAKFPIYPGQQITCLRGAPDAAITERGWWRCVVPMTAPTALARSPGRAAALLPPLRRRPVRRATAALSGLRSPRPSLTFEKPTLMSLTQNGTSGHFRGDSTAATVGGKSRWTHRWREIGFELSVPRKDGTTNSTWPVRTLERGRALATKVGFQRDWTRRWREMDSNHRSRHERAGFCCGRQIAGPSAGSQKGCFFMRYRWFESISLQRRVSCELDPRLRRPASCVQGFRTLGPPSRQRD